MSEVKLQFIENDRKITWESDSAFLYAFQTAVLLALVESGRLTEQQYRSAEIELRRQNYPAHS